ncbi:MAG: DUF4625 domain-containing protein [Saprospiraceae bacterium]|nr:DUF4625 domain-containing protein [Lewinella sp.]
MKTRIYLFVIAVTIGLFITSCEKDEVTTPKPEIDNFELGIGNSHIAYVGSDLHIEVEVVAEGTISTIEVEIHKEDGSGGWEYNNVYTEFSGLLNTTFHKHVDIPADAETGDYHFHFIVTDMAGRQTEVEEELEIAVLEDDEAPSITISTSPEDGQTFAAGETISISGTVADNVTLAGMLVALVRDNDGLSDAEVTGSNTSVIVMLHTHDFEDPASHTFTASIVVGAEYDNNMTPALIQGDNAWQAGDYYILVKSKDANGNGAASPHYPIKIDY